MVNEIKRMSYQHQKNSFAAKILLFHPKLSMNYLRISILSCACITMMLIASCGNTQSAPSTMHFRFIQQITAYLENGGVSYSDFVADSGTAEYSGNTAKINLDRFDGAGSVELSLQIAGDDVVIAIEGIETRGEQNSWIRVRKPDSDTFGSNTDCEIWVGRLQPTN